MSAIFYTYTLYGMVWYGMVWDGIVVRASLGLAP